MPDQELEIAQLIATFREGRDTLTEGLDLLDGQEFGIPAIHRLLEATRDLADQAQSLVQLLREGGMDEAALQDANDLAAFFWATEERIEAKLGLGRE